ncbi:hypothetical protein WA158_007584 [Blastocystis sp. Blastoise]
MGRLDRLEVENFKSYAGKQTIGPFKSFSCIIGPNGTGKSNIMDAISFVLGDASKKLRGKQLSDLIYRIDGEQSHIRKATVSLVYVVENDQLDGYENGDEIWFSRSVMHSGSSVYKIDDETKTQEEYQKMLESINILLKARNFMIFQGDIQNISNMSPEELTHLFEIISGSDQYKEEYDQCKEHVEESKLLMNNFAFEKKRLQNEKDKIRSQKEEANEYLQKQDELKHIKTDFFLWRLHHVQKEIETRNQEVEHLYREEKKRYQKEKASIKKQKEEKEEEIERLKSLKSKKNQKLIKIQEQIKRYKKDIDNMTKLIGTIDEEYVTQKRDLEGLQSDIKRIQTDYKSLSEKEIKNREGMVLDKSGENEYRRLLSIYKKQNTRIKNEYELKRKGKEVVEDKLKQYKQYYENFQQEWNDIQTDKEKQITRKSHISKASEENQSIIQTLSADIQKLSSQYEDKNKQLSQYTKDLALLEDRLQTVIDLKEASQKDKKITGIVNKLKDLFPDVMGRLYELCSPIQRKYDLCISTALGKYMDAIVVKTEATAQLCIQYLKDQRCPPMDIYPLESLRPNDLKEEYRQLGSNYKLCIDLVNYDPSVAVAFQYALNNVIVCDTINQARDLVFTRGIRVKVVTLVGDVINKNGSMTGGLYKAIQGDNSKIALMSRDNREKRNSRSNGSNSSNGGMEIEPDNSRGDEYNIGSRWEYKEYDDLMNQKNTLLSDIHTLEKELKYNGDNSDDMSVMKTRQANLLSKQKTLEGELRISNKNIAMYEERSEELRNKLEEIQNHIDDYEKELEIVSATVSDIQAKLNESEKEIFSSYLAKYNCRTLADFDSIYINILKEKDSKINEFKTNLNKLKSREEYCKNRVERLEKNKEESNRGKEKKEKEYNKLRTEEKSLSDNILVYTKDIDTTTDSLNELLLRMKNSEQNIIKIDRQINEVHDNLLPLQQKMTRLESEMEDFRSKRNTLLLNTKVEQIEIPLLSSSTPLSQGDNSFFPSISQTQNTPHFSQSNNPTVIRDEDMVNTINFEVLTRKEICKDENEYNNIEAVYQSQIEDISRALESSSPDLKSFDKYEEINNQYKKCYQDWEQCLKEKQKRETVFDSCKKKRCSSFMEAYNFVRNIIGSIYTELTRNEVYINGGMASLELTNTEEPYLGGIQYIVTPAGKGFRDITELSGGERSMATLALLFSIHKYRPSPFFIMDEIDAALDKYNVKQIGNYIVQLSKETQCIVISLKDMFYYLSDILVGVTKDIIKHSSLTFTLDLTQYNDSNDINESTANEIIQESRDIQDE